MYPLVRAFKAARLCCPAFVATTKLQPDAVDQVRVFPLLDEDEQICHLKEELAAYKVVANDFPVNGDRLHRWKN